MTPEERKAKDAARKREAYARRKAALSPKQPIHCNPTPEAEEAWKQSNYMGKIQPLSEEQLAEYVSSREKAEGNSELQSFPPGVLYQDHREQARAIQAESAARTEYIDLLFSKFERCTNIPQLLQAILKEQITLRVTLTDLIGGLYK